MTPQHFMEKLKSQWQHPSAKFWMIAGGILFAFFLAITGHSSPPHPEAAKPHQTKKSTSIDTLIPPGKVLIPIDVQNLESLDSILGTHGVVDLYAASLSSGKPTRAVARGIKILRAPQNPHHFAVLAPESEAAKIVKHPGSFYVVIQNPNRVGTDFVNSPTKRRRIIIETKE